MPVYNYLCLDCEQQTKNSLKKNFLSAEDHLQYTLFETSHRMNPTKNELQTATVCPRCNNNNCIKSLIGTNIVGYIKGNGFLDKAGVNRDMNLFKLTTDDPYGKYRVAGEVDHIKTQLKSKGKRNTKPKHFVASNKSMESAVKKAVKNK